jgi:hypothetical protein
MTNPLNRGAPITGRTTLEDLREYADRLNKAGFSIANNWHWKVARRKVPGPDGIETTQIFLDRQDATNR